MMSSPMDLRRGPRRVIGLTGGIGAGKSTVLALLNGWGAATLDADAVVREALANDRSIQRRVVCLLGPEVQGSGGGLDRGRIAARVFRRPRLRKRLEALLHPLVRRAFRRRLRCHRRGWLILEAPLLFEAGLDRLVDETWVVWAPPRLCQDRLVRYRGFSASEVRRRRRAQMPPAEKKRRADRVIPNDGTRRNLSAEIRRLLSAAGDDEARPRPVRGGLRGRQRIR